MQVTQALITGRAASVPALNLHGTNNQIEAQLRDFIETMAAVTGRTLQWKDGAAAQAIAQDFAEGSGLDTVRPASNGMPVTAAAWC